MKIKICSLQVGDIFIKDGRPFEVRFIKEGRLHFRPAKHDLYYNNDLRSIAAGSQQYVTLERKHYEPTTEQEDLADVF